MDSKSDIEHFRVKLVEMRDGLREEGDLELEPDTKAGGEGKVDEDAAPLSEMNQVIASSRNRERARRLAQIQRVLDLLQKDPESFGICEDCEDEIPRPRLELMPWARLCIACQGRQEDDVPRGARKNLRDYR